MSGAPQEIDDIVIGHIFGRVCVDLKVFYAGDPGNLLGLIFNVRIVNGRDLGYDRQRFFQGLISKK